MSLFLVLNMALSFLSLLEAKFGRFGSFIVIYVVLLQVPIGTGSLSTVLVAVRAILIPMAVLGIARRREGWVEPRVSTGVVISFGLFLTYATLTLFWAEFPMIGLRGVIYMFGLGILARLLSGMRNSGWLPDIYWAWASAAAVAAVLLLGESAAAEPGRLGAFGGAQALAQFIVVVTVVLIYSAKSHIGRAVIFVLGLTTVLATGSRTGLALLVVIALVAVVAASLRGRPGALAVTLGALVGGQLMLLGLVSFDGLPEGRAFDAARAIQSGDGINTVGTAGWRLAMSERVAAATKEGDLDARVVGEGVGDAARFSPDYTASGDAGSIDGNRVVHNDYLRIFLEFGFIGAALGAAFVLQVIRLSMDSLKVVRNLQLCFILLVLLGVQNVLASAGTVAGVAVCLALACIFDLNGRDLVSDPSRPTSNEISSRSSTRPLGLHRGTG